jgi:hypothetical protein
MEFYLILLLIFILLLYVNRKKSLKQGRNVLSKNFDEIIILRLEIIIHKQNLPQTRNEK